jgi:uncharacterized metal-binding protein
MTSDMDMIYVCSNCCNVTKISNSSLTGGDCVVCNSGKVEVYTKAGKGEQLRES